MNSVDPVLVGVGFLSISVVCHWMSQRNRTVQRKNLAHVLEKNPMKKYCCIALDLDGTALNSRHEFSDTLIAIIEKLQQNGVTVTICTGRSVSSVLPKLQSLRAFTDIPLVVYNGTSSFVMSPTFEIKKKLFSTPHSAEDADVILAFARRQGLVAQYYMETSGEVFAAPTCPLHHELLQAYEALVGRKQIIGNSYETVTSQSLAAKILIMTSDADSLIFNAEMEFGLSRFNIIKGSPDPFFLEFLPSNTSKGSGLINMCNALRIPVGSVVAFGDGENDKEFLMHAGLGIAMNNAKVVTKEVADVVLEHTNDEDGVALALQLLERYGAFSETLSNQQFSERV